jgi:hypothetical protein
MLITAGTFKSNASHYQASLLATSYNSQFSGEILSKLDLLLYSYLNVIQAACRSE